MRNLHLLKHIESQAPHHSGTLKVNGAWPPLDYNQSLEIRSRHPCKTEGIHTGSHVACVPLAWYG